MIQTIAWNPLGFYLLDVLPKGKTFNAEYYCVDILIELLPLGPQVDGMRLVIHADNETPHRRKIPSFLQRKSVLPRHTPTILT
jgi:hypothetical protein